MPERDAGEIASQLRGKSILIYMIRRGRSRVGVREVQRALGLSSPSVAHHHMEKLRGLGLLEKSATGEYRVIGRVDVGFSFLVAVVALTISKRFAARA